MRKWEYKMIEEADLQGNRMDKLGEDGWELVSVIWFDNGFARFYFKRENKW